MGRASRKPIRITSLKDIAQLAAQCTRFLNGHPPRTVRSHLHLIAESPLALQRSDGYGQGGYIADLEREVADLLGKESAVFMPSGTMAQPIALRIWSDLAETKRVAFHPTCHLELHEHGAYRELHGLEGVLVGAIDQMMTLDDVRRVADPISTLLIELPQREIGGQLPPWDELQALCAHAVSRGMKLHLDGARLWECQPYYGRTYAEIVAPFDSVYVSFYKILGGLPGAMLAGPSGLIEQARIWQRRQGGNLQQQAPSAIAAKLGLDHHLPKIPLYVAKAAEIADVLREFDLVRIVPEHPPTNMMHLYLAGDPERLLAASHQIAEEEHTALFFRLGANGKVELNVGEGALEIDRAELRRLFERLFSLAG